MMNQARTAWALAMMMALSSGCDSEEKIAGCEYVDHVFTAEVREGGLTTRDDTMKLFVAAGEPRELAAPIEAMMHEAQWLEDSLVVEMSVYGQSYDDEPSPYLEKIWMGDTLVIYFSGFPFNVSFFDCPGGPERTPPCLPPWYRIDYMEVWHPAGTVVTGRDEPLGPHSLCEWAQEK